MPSAVISQLGKGSIPLSPSAQVERDRTFGSTIHRVHEWHEIAVGERAANEQRGMTLQEIAPVESIIRCPLCHIYLGKDYVNKEIYLYPVYNMSILASGKQHQIGLQVLIICGSCATHKHLNLSLEYCLVSAADWKTELQTLPQLALQHWLVTIRDVAQALLFFCVLRCDWQIPLFRAIAIIQRALSVPLETSAIWPIKSSRPFSPYSSNQVTHLTKQREALLTRYRSTVGSFLKFGKE